MNTLHQHLFNIADVWQFFQLPLKFSNFSLPYILHAWFDFSLTFNTIDDVCVRLNRYGTFVILGGTRSLSVFDNNLGSGSISPLIATGGKAGDVGLHDFRYVATGRTKKHKHNDIREPHGNISSTADMQGKSGDQNRNGMLWYIPKAHIGTANIFLLNCGLFFCIMFLSFNFLMKGVLPKCPPSQIRVFS